MKIQRMWHCNQVWFELKSLISIWYFIYCEIPWPWKLKKKKRKRKYFLIWLKRMYRIYIETFHLPCISHTVGLTHGGTNDGWINYVTVHRWSDRKKEKEVYVGMSLPLFPLKNERLFIKLMDGTVQGTPKKTDWWA